MKRRTFLASASATALAPLAATAQAPEKVYRVAYIATSTPVSDLAGPNPRHPGVQALLHRLRDLGYVEGRNLVFERRSAEGRSERYREIVAELVGLRAHVIVTSSATVIAYALEVTKVVPIVMTGVLNPVEAGLVASLARPGGNVTGITGVPVPTIQGKRLEVLKEALPNIARVAFLATPSDWDGPWGENLRVTAHALGTTILHAEHWPSQYEEAFAEILAARPDAMIVAPNSSNYLHGRMIAAFAAKHRLPALYPWREPVEAGGLMSFGTNIRDLYRRSADYVDRILKGASPANLPVEMPLKFELIINLRTAHALGVKIAPSVLARADELIE